jgi:hypothetical protein
LLRRERRCLVLRRRRQRSPAVHAGLLIFP